VHVIGGRARPSGTCAIASGKCLRKSWNDSACAANPAFACGADYVLGTDRHVRRRGSAELPPVEGVHSVVYVMRKPALASRNVAAARSVGTSDCVERLSLKEASGNFLGHEPYKSQIKASSLPFPLSGLTGYGLRVRGEFAAVLFHQKRRQPFYEDTFGFAVGPAEIVLRTVGVARPFPTAARRRTRSRSWWAPSRRTRRQRQEKAVGAGCEIASMCTAPEES
jgi:hypothetical protein